MRCFYIRFLALVSIVLCAHSANGMKELEGLELKETAYQEQPGSYLHLNILNPTIHIQPTTKSMSVKNIRDRQDALDRIKELRLIEKVPKSEDTAFINEDFIKTNISGIKREASKKGIIIEDEPTTPDEPTTSELIGGAVTLAGIAAITGFLLYKGYRYYKRRKQESADLQNILSNHTNSDLASSDQEEM